MTEAFVSTIRKYPLLPRHTWYFVSGVALSALNRPEEIRAVYTHALERGASSSDTVPSHDEKLEISRKMREALIKSAAICGLPKVGVTVLEPIHWLTWAQSSVQSINALDEPLAYSPTGRQSDIYDTPSSQLMHRGKIFFDKIYGKVSARVLYVPS